MYQNPYGTNRMSIMDVIPGLGKFVMNQRQKMMQPILDAGRERAMSLLGTEGTAFEDIDATTRFEDVQEAEGLLADPQDFGNQMRFSLGLLATPGYSDLGSSVAQNALTQQLGLPMELMKMHQQMNKPTSAIQNFEYGMENPEFMAYQQAMRPQTNINMPNQSELLAGAQATQAVTTGAMVNEAYDNGYMPSAADYAAGLLPDFIGGPLMSEEGRRQQATEFAWAEANLRNESGGVINAEEWKQKRDTYFPLPWDDPATVQRKRELRQIQEQGLIRQAGRSTVTPVDVQSQPQITATPSDMPAGTAMTLPPGAQAVQETQRRERPRRPSGLNR